jgi:transcriptional regulator with XRE-family HTH domain
MLCYITGGDKMNKLKELRKDKNLTQAELAKLLDVDRSTIAQWERGENMPRAKMLIRLAKIFKCKVDALLCV